MLIKWIDLMEFGSVLLKEFSWRYAPWAIALAPATFFGFSMFDIAHLVMPVEFSIVVGISTAIGLELVGVSAAGTAVELYELWRAGRSDATRFYLASVMVMVYVAVGILTVLGSEFQGAFKLVGVAMFVLAPVSYVTMALMRFVSANRVAEGNETTIALEEQQRSAEWQRQQDQADHEHRRQLELMKTKARIQSDFARIEQEAQVKIERSKANAAARAAIARRGHMVGQNPVRTGGQKKIDNDGRKVSTAEAERLLLAFFSDNPTGSYSQAAGQCGRSKAWVTKKVAEFIESGQLTRKVDRLVVEST